MSDAFVSFGTTATFDALISNLHTICPVFDDWAWSEVFVNSNAAVIPRNKEELVLVFQNISDNSFDIFEKIKVSKNNFIYN